MNLIKFNLIALFILTASTGLGGEGVVIVLEAPLYLKPSYSSKVVQIKKKNQKIFINDRHFKQSRRYLDKLTRKVRENSFYETYARNGYKAYVPAVFVKLLYSDLRESLEPLKPYAWDPTDYRIEEPLPDNFPFDDYGKYRSILAFSVGSEVQSGYPYQQSFDHEDYGKRYGLVYTYTKRADWDKSSRLFFGGIFLGTMSINRIQEDEGRQSKENRYRLGAGPILTYEAYRLEEHSLTLGMGLTINRETHEITAVDSEDGEESRTFRGLYLAPRAMAYFKWNKIFSDVKNLSLLLGIDMEFVPRNSLEPSSEPLKPELWGPEEPDAVRLPGHLRLNILLGIQVKV